MINSEPFLIHLIADYGDDNARNEVIAALRAKFGTDPDILCTDIENFNTVQNGFWIAQHALAAPRGLKVLVYHNVAPRKDDKNPRVDNRGEALIGLRLKNGNVIVGPNSGHSLSFVPANQVGECFEIFVGGKSQFRSRDVFIEPAFEFWYRSTTLEGLSVDPTQVASPLTDPVVVHVDNYGNVKTNITSVNAEPGDILRISVGKMVVEAVLAGGAFHQAEGQLGFVPGSSGWSDPFYEIFLRGHSAADYIELHSNNESKIHPGDPVTISLAREPNPTSLERPFERNIGQTGK